MGISPLGGGPCEEPGEIRTGVGLGEELAPQLVETSRGSRVTAGSLESRLESPEGACMDADETCAPKSIGQSIEPYIRRRTWFCRQGGMGVDVARSSSKVRPWNIETSSDPGPTRSSAVGAHRPVLLEPLAGLWAS